MLETSAAHLEIISDFGMAERIICAGISCKLFNDISSYINAHRGGAYVISLRKWCVLAIIEMALFLKWQ